MRTKLLSVLALGAILFSGCSSDDEIVNNDPQAVKFTAGVNQATTPGVRAAGTTWGANDAIGLFMVDNGLTTIAEGASNKQHSTGGDGNFAPVSGDEIYYPMDGSAVDFIAYYPYAVGNTIGNVISVDVAGTQTATSQATIDLLWAKANGTAGAGYSKTNGTVALSFDHKLSKIVMNVKVEDNTGIVGTDFDVASVTIKGMNTKNTFDLETGTLKTAGTTADISPRKLGTSSVGYLASYDAIIMPSSYGANTVTVVFMVNNEPYTWKLTAANAAFVAGNEYSYEVTLTRTGVTVTGTIKPWTGIDRGSVTAN